MILIKNNINKVEEFNYLYDAVGWGSYDNDISKESLKTLFILSLYMMMIK